MKLNSVLFVLSERCSVGCDHCGYIGTTRKGDAQQSEVVEWISQVAAWGIPGLLFTGGEPFDRLDVLSAAVQAAHAAGTRCGVFTSSRWASSPAQARAVLGRLAGLSRIYLSTDIYHQKRVPVQYVRNAIDAAISSGIPDINLNITFTTDQARIAVASQYEDYGGRVRIHADRVIPNPHHERALLEGQDPPRSLEPNDYPSRCWIGTPFVNYNGDVFTCHMGAGSTPQIPYFLGSLRSSSFSTLMAKAEHRLDYQFLRTHGPRGMAELVRSYPAVFCDLAHTTFTTDCDMCRSVITHPGAQEALIDLAEARQNEIAVRRALILGEISASLEQGAGPSRTPHNPSEPESSHRPSAWQLSLRRDDCSPAPKPISG